MTAQGKPDRCPSCGSDERSKCNLLPTPAGYEDLCCDDWHSSPVPAAAPQAESVPSGKDVAEEIVQLVCNSFRVDDPPDIPWDVSVAEVRQRIERFASQKLEAAERSNSLLRERLTAAVVITNWGEHNAMKCLVCGDESYDHWAFQHRSNCEFEAALKEKP